MTKPRTQCEHSDLSPMRLAFDQLRDSFVEQYEPANAHERTLVEQLAQERTNCLVESP